MTLHQIASKGYTPYVCPCGSMNFFVTNEEGTDGMIYIQTHRNNIPTQDTLRIEPPHGSNHSPSLVKCEFCYATVPDDIRQMYLPIVIAYLESIARPEPEPVTVVNVPTFTLTDAPAYTFQPEPDEEDDEEEWDEEPDGDIW